MDTKFLLLNLIIYSFELFIFYDYASRVFEKRRSVLTVWISMIVGHLVLYGVFCFTYSHPDNAFANLFSLFVINGLMFYFLFNSSLAQAVFHSIIVIALMMIAETASISVIALFSGEYTYSLDDNWGLYFTSCAIDKTFYFVLCKITSSFATKNNREKYGRMLFLMLIFPLATLFVLYSFYIFAINPHGSPNLIFLICSTVMFIANFGIFLVYDHITKESSMMAQMNIEKQSYELDNQYLEYINQKQTEYRIFMHDIKNHLETIRCLTDDAEIKKYIDSIYENTKALDSYYDTDNKALNLILSKYTTLFKSESITFETYIDSSALNFMAEADLSTYLNNLFKNSFESAAKSKERKVRFSLSVTDSAYIISLVNSCDEPPARRGDKFITSKKERDLHGFGTKSVERIIKKYGGSYECDYDEQNKLFKFITVFQADKLGDSVENGKSDENRFAGVAAK